VAFRAAVFTKLGNQKNTSRVSKKHAALGTNRGLLPDWAFFVKCVVNANDLRPTASRESFYEDEKLAATREAWASNCDNM